MLRAADCSVERRVTATEGRRRGQLLRGAIHVGAFDEETIRAEQRQRMLDRRGDSIPELAGQLVHCPRAVEQRQEPRQQRLDGAALERDDGAAVLDEASASVADEAAPRMQPRSLRKRRLRALAHQQSVVQVQQRMVHEQRLLEQPGTSSTTA